MNASHTPESVKVLEHFKQAERVMTSESENDVGGTLKCILKSVFTVFEPNANDSSTLRDAVQSISQRRKASDAVDLFKVLNSSALGKSAMSNAQSALQSQSKEMHAMEILSAAVKDARVLLTTATSCPQEVPSAMSSRLLPFVVDMTEAVSKLPGSFLTKGRVPGMLRSTIENYTMSIQKHLRAYFMSKFKLTLKDVLMLR